jgi:glycyl-tRNA synthetase beta chain
MSSTRNLLLEIGTEEIPAGFIAPALSDMKELAERGLKEARLGHGGITVSGTPRRLVLYVEELADRQPDREEKVTGPPVKIAFDDDGNPTDAAKGFARNHNVLVAQLKREKTERGEYLVLNRTDHGRNAMDIMKEFLPELISSIHFSKTMKWGDRSERFARPVRWIVALLGGEVVKFSFAGVQASAMSMGHRFMHNNPVKVAALYGDYIRTMKDAYVIVDRQERRGMLLEAAEKAAKDAGGRLLDDPELADLNLDLVEYPEAVCGRFDDEFLKLPQEVLITCMREHQKYFSVVDITGNLMANFVAINNTPSPKPDLVRSGHEKVIRARLSDAAFFFNEDLKTPLEERVDELAGMVFHRKLGTLLDKTHRIQELAVYLADLVAPEVRNICSRAAWLCKADLLTEMVGEFPDLQGIMGREYAAASGETADVARTIAEHYMPLKSGGTVPPSLSGAVLSIADRLDTICATFAINLRPTGTQDPYALKRHALAIIAISREWGFSYSLNRLVEFALQQLAPMLPELPEGLHGDIILFIQKRFVHDLLADTGLQHDTINAAVNAEFDDLLDTVMRAMAIQNVRSRPEFEPLSIAFKRVMNILKGYSGGVITPELLEEDAEKELYNAYVDLKERVSPMIDKEQGLLSGNIDYEGALLELLQIKPRVDNFFDNVMVMADDEKIRENRLAMLWYISRLFLTIGDLSAITTRDAQ